MLTSFLAAVAGHSHMTTKMMLPKYQLDQQMAKAPIILYGKDVSDWNDCEPNEKCKNLTDCDPNNFPKPNACLYCEDDYSHCAPMRRDANFTVHAALRDNGWLLMNQTIHVGMPGSATDEHLTKLPRHFDGEAYIFVSRMEENDQITYHWYEELGFAAIHQGDVQGHCGIMADSLDIPYMRCPYVCPDNQTLLHGHKCYYQIDAVDSFDAAKEMCDNNNGSILSLNAESYMYFQHWLGHDLFWVENSFTGEEADKPGCGGDNMPWDSTMIEEGSAGAMVLVNEMGYCVHTDGKPASAKAICHKDPDPYVARSYNNTAPEDHSLMFETTDTMYGYCCEKAHTIEPRHKEVSFMDRMSSSVEAAYMLGPAKYDHYAKDETQSMIVIFEDSGYIGSHGGQRNPYLVYLALVENGNDTNVIFPFKGIVPSDLHNLSYNLYVVKLPHHRDVMPPDNYSTHECGDSSGRCFFHLNAFMEAVGGEVITMIHWDVVPDITTISTMLSGDMDTLRRTSDLCKQIYPHFEPFSNGLPICEHPVAESNGLRSNFHWIIIMALIGLYNCYIG